MKTTEWHENRRRSIGGSDATIIVNGTEEQRLKLWQVKCGLAEPENLDDVFQVQFGLFTEPFNLEWFEKKSGLAITGQQEQHVTGWRSCTLDGRVETIAGPAIVEAKHVNARYTIETCLAHYQPQLHHNMQVCGFKKAFLTAIIGNAYDYIEVDYDADYAAKVLKAEEEFWDCVQLQIPPSPLPEEIAAPAATRAVDMTGNNEWASDAAEWLASKDAAKRFDDAAARLKKMVPADVRLASGHGIRIGRDKRRYLSIKQEG